MRPRLSAEESVSLVKDVLLNPTETSGFGTWLNKRLRPSQQVTSLVPDGFEGYVRLFHPGKQLDTSGHVIAFVRWAQVARANQRTAHRLMQWANITASDLARPQLHSPAMLEAPDEGTLPVALAQAVRDTLQTFTPTQTRIGYALWSGFRCKVQQATSLIAGRHYHLFEGSLAELTHSFCAGSHQSANIVWSADHEWCLVSDVDMMSSYLGGSQQVIDALLGHPALETCQVSPSDTITFDSDSVNPLPL